MELSATSTLHAYFREALDRAVANQRIATTEETACYLVCLLAEFAAQPICTDALGFKMLESMAGSAAERVTVLKEVGDTSLFVSGYFPESLNPTTIDVDYYVGIGQVAYGELSRLSRSSQASTVFTELANKFRGFVEVLTEISADAVAASPKEVLRLYERYLQTGNRAAARVLRTQGVFVPVAGGRASDDEPGN